MKGKQWLTLDFTQATDAGMKELISFCSCKSLSLNGTNTG